MVLSAHREFIQGFSCFWVNHADFPYQRDAYALARGHVACGTGYRGAVWHPSCYCFCFPKTTMKLIFEERFQFSLSDLRQNLFLNQ